MTMLQENQPWLEKGERLICFGDSITASQTGYTAIIQEKLGAKGIEVINAGRGGDKTPWALTRLHSDVIDRKPNAVSIFLGANDAAVGRHRWNNEPRVEPEAYKNNLVWMIHLCRLFGKIEKFSITTPAYRFEGVTFEEQGDFLSIYCRMAREAADEAKVLLVPFDVAFRRYWEQHEAENQNGRLLTTDGTHMLPAGNQLIAETMLKTWNLL